MALTKAAYTAHRQGEKRSLIFTRAGAGCMDSRCACFSPEADLYSKDQGGTAFSNEQFTAEVESDVGFSRSNPHKDRSERFRVLTHSNQQAPFICLLKFA